MKLVVHGDSNSAYTYVSNGATHWTDIVKTEMGFDTLVNLSTNNYYVTHVAADTSSIISEDPDLALVMVGTNDIHLATNDTRTVASIISTAITGYTTIIDDLQSEDIKVVLMSPPFHPFARVAAMMPEYCEAMSRLCFEKGVPFVDVWTYMKRKSETMTDADFRDMFQAWTYSSSWILDVHLDTGGHAMVAQAVLSSAFFGGASEEEPSGEVVNLCVFDGTNDYVTKGGALTGAADGKKGTISVWFKSADTSGQMAVLYFASSNGVAAYIGTDGKIHIDGYNTSAATILSIVSTITVDDGNLHHLMASWDLATATAYMYIDGSSVLAGGSTLTNQNIDYTPASSPDHFIGGYAGGTLKLNGQLGQFYFNQAESIDLSNGTNRAKFYNSGNPVDLGSTGSTPTGTAPIICLKGAYTSFGTNSGTGGNFTVTGTLTSGGTYP